MIEGLKVQGHQSGFSLDLILGFVLNVEIIVKSLKEIIIFKTMSALASRDK